MRHARRIMAGIAHIALLLLIDALQGVMLYVGVAAAVYITYLANAGLI